MSYQMYDTVPNIIIVHNDKVFLLAKKYIKEIAVVREDVIKISTGNCLSSIYFHHKDVTTPVTISATQLVGLLNTWLGPTGEK